MPVSMDRFDRTSARSGVHVHAGRGYAEYYWYGLPSAELLAYVTARTLIEI
jgi:hypothetical protein